MSGGWFSGSAGSGAGIVAKSWFCVTCPSVCVRGRRRSTIRPSRIIKTSSAMPITRSSRRLATTTAVRGDLRSRTARRSFWLVSSRSPACASSTNNSAGDFWSANANEMNRFWSFGAKSARSLDRAPAKRTIARTGAHRPPPTTRAGGAPSRGSLGFAGTPRDRVPSRRAATAATPHGSDPARRCAPSRGSASRAPRRGAEAWICRIPRGRRAPWCSLGGFEASPARSNLWVRL